jgi:hypothetical protein
VGIQSIFTFHLFSKQFEHTTNSIEQLSQTSIQIIMPNSMTIVKIIYGPQMYLYINMLKEIEYFLYLCDSGPGQQSVGDELLLIDGRVASDF